MIIVLVLLLAVSLSTTIWYKRKKAHYRIPQITLQDNKLHETDDNENEDQISERIPTNILEQSDVQGTDVHLIDNKTLEISMLPEWLRDKPEMIFPLTSTQKGQELGRGQYGTIFKGKLVLGKSVCVDFM